MSAAKSRRLGAVALYWPIRSSSVLSEELLCSDGFILLFFQVLLKTSFIRSYYTAL